MAAFYRDVRRPKEMDALLSELCERQRPFASMRDVLVFAAALGWSRKERVAFQQSGERIAWSTMQNRIGTESLVNMMSTSESGDPEILASGRESERLLIFEEYACGGLQILDRMLRAQPHVYAGNILAELVRDSLEVPADDGLPPELAVLGKSYI